METYSLEASGKLFSMMLYKINSIGVNGWKNDNAFYKIIQVIFPRKVSFLV